MADAAQYYYIQKTTKEGDSKMKRVMNKDDLVRAVAEKSGFYISSCKVMVEALEEVILENMKLAKVGADSELYIAKGLYFHGTRKAEHEARDPRNQNIIITPEKVIPSCEFKQSFRDKLYSGGRGYEKKRRIRQYNMAQKAKKESGGDST